MKRKATKKILFTFFLAIVAGLFSIIWLSARPPSGVSQSLKWHTGFSRSFAVDMGLDWRETYLAILDDLKPESLRLPIYWPDIEPRAHQYVFDDYDWLTDEAQKRNVKLILIIGRKLPRWPECHIPDWALKLTEGSQQTMILNLIKAIVSRYRNLDNLSFWQVENEPFLPYGECPGRDAKFLEKEISLTRSLDPGRPIMITDSGELSDWLRAAKRADIFGTTMYRIIWKWPLGYFKYPLPPKFFWFKANLVHLFYPGLPIIVSELQAEPWGPKLNYELSLKEQLRSMDLEQFSDNIEYAKSVGFPEVYLWGAEWWYWLKVKQNQPDFWNYAKKLIAQTPNY